MTPIQFYFGSGSPYAWKVWLALEHLALPYEAIRMTFDGGELKAPAFTAINPRQKVPAIVVGDFAMYESGPILDYLDEAFPQAAGKVWPGDARARAVARRRAAEAVAYLDPINDKLLTAILVPAGTEPDPAAIAAARGELAGELARIAAWFAPAQPFAAGNAISGADFTLYPYLAFLGRVDVRKPGHDLKAMLPPVLLDYTRLIEALPYFEKTIPPHWKG